MKKVTLTPQSSPSVRPVAPGLALVSLALAQAIAAANFSIVYVALPSIGRDLDFSSTDLQWVASAYTLMVGGFLMLAGRAVDLLGKRRLLFTALTVFGASSLVSGFAASQAMLIAGRAGQGLGGAMLTPAVLALLNATFPDGRERHRAYAVWGGAGSAGGAIGLVLGGMLTAALSWHWVMLANVPAVAAAMIVSAQAFPRDPHPGRGRRELIRRFDIPGAVTITLTALFLVFGLIQGSAAGWASPVVLVAFAGALVAAVSLIAVERRQADALLPFALLRRRSLLAGMFVAFVFYAIFGSQQYLLNLWLQTVKGWDAFAAGLAALPLMIATVATARFAHQFARLLGLRWTITTGLLLGGVGLMLIGIPLHEHGDYASVILPGLVVLGLAQGMTYATLWMVATAGIDSARAGVATALTSTVQSIGSPIGLAVLVAVATTGLPADATAHAVNAGLRWATITAGVVSMASAIISYALIPGSAPRPRSHA
ncbi:MFS transporter [Actinoplanes sp. Pm04-4]|uniref:MFS transporter n=1 Tax=Paractinoplanes pyxinae TaxID=2997416 RepID=A0ABT4B765_9ACTN|nr:MFS transporter [Actinoplanes pyxinae]MCY1141448.1 MFS transporter [Actinoplanes pyxinae]